MVADESFRPAKNNGITVVRKPFFCLPIINILNRRNPLDNEISEKTDIICPGVKALVADEPMNLMVAEGIFKAYQMEVKTAESGMEAIELCKREEFDLIFLDHMMPEMDGIETLKTIRKTMMDTRNSRIFIAFSANVVSGAREMFLREGFNTNP